MTMIIDGTNGGFFPSWTTATRPASPAVGQMGYNTTTGAFDAYTAAGWVSVASSATVSGPAFSTYMSANQSVSANTWTKMTFNTEYFDTDSCYDTSNYRFTPTKAGIYQVSANGNSAPGTGNFFYQGIYKNGTRIGLSGLYAGGSNINDDAYENVSLLVSMNGTTDYLEAWGITNISGTTFGSGTSDTSFSATWIRSN